MLAEHQVIHLLGEAERLLGKRLEGIRGHLKSKVQVRSAIWELILVDAASRTGKVEYERPTGSGRTPDLYVETAQGPLWIEAAFLFPRFDDVEARQEAFRRAVWAEERRLRITPGSMRHEFYGQQAPYGYEMTLPAQHELTSFFRSEFVSGFFNTAKDNPDQPMMVDLRECGATVRLAYIPSARNSGSSSTATSSSVVIEQPRDVTEHAVFRLLVKKAKKYHARDLRAPLVVCIGSERSTAVRSMVGPMTVSTETAVREACRKYPVLSAVIVVSIEHAFPTPGDLNASRRPRVRAVANHSATFPLSETLLRHLNLRFDLIDYGQGWNEWEGVSSAQKRLEKLGGSLMWEMTKDGYAVTLPAHEILRVLGGGSSAAELQANYTMSDAENPLRRALHEGRSIVGIELLAHDGRGHEPQKMRIAFGPPTPLLLQTPKA